MVNVVKMREKGKKAWWFVTPKGSGNRLKIHAAQFESAEAVAAFITKYAAENPELEFKAATI